MGNVGEREIYYDELRYLTLRYKTELEEKYGKGIWDDESSASLYEEELRALVASGIVDGGYYAVLELADRYYSGGSAAMTTEKEIEQAVSDEINETAEELGGKKKYFELLETEGLSDRLFRFYLNAGFCADELSYVLINDLGVIANTEEANQKRIDEGKLIRTNHIFIEGKTEESRKKAESIRNELLLCDASELYNTFLIKKTVYCTDTTITTLNGAYFARYTSNYGDAYEKTAVNTEIGKIGELLETDSGYYVIIRLELEQAYVKKNYESVVNQLLGSEFNEIIDDIKKEQTFTFNELGASIVLSSVK